MLSDSLKEKVEEQIGEKIQQAESTTGGCIADSYLLDLTSGERVFLKSAGRHNPDLFHKEAHGLKELKKAGCLPVPEVRLISEDFIVLEAITTGSPDEDFWLEFGRGLAQLHQFRSDHFGFYEDNYLGLSPQKNTPQRASENGQGWPEFYYQNRILFQLQLAEKKQIATDELRHLIGRLENKIDNLLQGSEEPPCLIHGDLWNGNYMVNELGNPVLIDPAVYYGHREAELGMTRLFGGFPPEFYKAYDDTYPLKEGWEERNEVYRLYHVLNHFNLFGSSYYDQSVTILRRLL